RHFLAATRQVVTPADFSGLKTRVAPERMFLDIWKAVGVNPTPMNYGEVYAALETSTLDAVEINLTSIESEKYDEIAKHLTLTGHYFWPSLMVVNKAVFDRLTTAQRDAMSQAADDILEPQVRAVEALDQKLLADLRARGMQIVEPSAELIGAMRTAVAPVVSALTRSDPQVAAFVAGAGRERAAASSK
ncbi:MAG TPA: TRAP transporter substrate-binding protein, partial [Vicinamibacterales bacterium]|nr:TRAP transporter substrate-binding protein [Vicinamibacterales bacterium]